MDFGRQDSLLDEEYSYDVLATDSEDVVARKETEALLGHKTDDVYDWFWPTVQDYAGLDTTKETFWIPRYLKEVRITKETVIARGGFSNCIDLVHINLPLNTIKEVLNYAFYNCSSLTEMVIPTAVRSLLPQTFNKCSSLQYLEIPFIGVSASADGEESLFGVILEPMTMVMVRIILHINNMILQ